MPKPNQQPSGWQPIVAGATAGSAMTLMGHPFDTTKVRMQVHSTRYRSTLHCLQETVAVEGAAALYKGLAPAIMTTCLTSGLRFGVQHKFNTLLASRLATTEREASFEQLPAMLRVVAEAGGGAACGAVLPLIFTPMELIKCRRQVATDVGATNVQIAMTVWREKGLAGLYTGHTLTVARSTLGNATLFGSYEGWNAVLSRLGMEHSAATTHMLAGVLSGWTTQFICFPIDAVKSRVQVTGGAGGVSGLVNGLLALRRERALYRGISAMLLRAIPVHMIYMPCYSFVLDALSLASRPPFADGGGPAPGRLIRRRTTHSDV